MEKEPKSLRHSGMGPVDGEAERGLMMGVEQPNQEEDELDWLTKADQQEEISPQGM
jgi:hypothetical protein